MENTKVSEGSAENISAEEVATEQVSKKLADQEDSEKTEKETVPTNVVSDKSGVVVQVNLSPQFNISDTNDSDVIRLIKAHIKELADDLGSEIATMLSEAYENTPVTT